MDVFIIPVGRDRYELYCEPPPVDVGDDADVASSRGLIARLRQQFTTVLRAAEERQYQRRGPGDAPQGWFARVRERALGWIAQRVAEQRLLWNLRSATCAVAVHPVQMPFDEVTTVVHAALQRDYRRHRVWLVVDVAGLLVSAPLVVVPGPNALGYYFAFRVVGHWLSMRGAMQGVHRVAWSSHPCGTLDELRDVVTLGAPVRDARIRDIASRLQLRHLSTFVERVAMRHA